MALVVTVAGSILTTRRTGNRNYFFRTMASNDRANPAGPRIKTETVPSDVHAGHVLEMKRDPSDPECGHIKHLTRTSQLLEILQRKNLICIKLTMATTRERSTHMLI